MKIAAFASFGPSLTKFRGPLLGAMVNEGHEVIASAPDCSADAISELAALGVRYQSLPLNRRGLNPISDLNYLSAVRRFLLRESIDVCFLYTIKPVIFGSLAARLARVPKTYSLITGLGYTFIAQRFPANFLFFVVKRLYALALQRNQHVFFQNGDDRDLFTHLSLVDRSKTSVVNGSGVDLDFFAPAPLPDGPLTFLMIARLLRAKGTLEFLQAASLVKTTHPGCRFRLIGPFEKGPDSVHPSEIAPWVQNGTVDYIGPVADVRPHLRECSVYVLPSYREGTPRSVLEAMACARPIITTDVPGCRQTVPDGSNGFLIPARDVEHLAAAMARFVADPQLAAKMGASSRKLAVERYDVRQVTRSMLETMQLINIGRTNVLSISKLPLS